MDVFTKTNDAACKAYLSTCYLSAANTCTATGACDSYTPAGSDDAAKATSCNALKDTTGNVCGFKTGTKCSAKACDDIFTKTNDAACKAYLSSCYLSAATTCAATKTAACSTYDTTGTDAEKAAICNSHLDTTGAVCGFIAGASKCSAKSCLDVFTKTDDAACKAYLSSCYLSAAGVCTATKTAACDTYNVTGGDSEKAALCKSQLDSAGAVCGFVQSATKCSAKSCTDFYSKPNDAACKAYLPACYLSAAGVCSATKTGACDSYNVTGTDAEKVAICNSHLDTTGAVCGFVAAATKCSAKSCTDIFTKTDDAACKAYLSSCYLSAAGVCSAVGAGACDSYTVTGADNPAKATFCNSKVDTTGVACGF